MNGESKVDKNVEISSTDKQPRQWPCSWLVVIIMVAAALSAVATVIVIHIPVTGGSVLVELNQMADLQDAETKIHDSKAQKFEERNEEETVISSDTRSKFKSLWGNQKQLVKNHTQQPYPTVVRVYDLIPATHPSKFLLNRKQVVILNRCESTSCYCETGKCVADPAAPKHLKEIVAIEHSLYNPFTARRLFLTAEEDTACICRND